MNPTQFLACLLAVVFPGFHRQFRPGSRQKPSEGGEPFEMNHNNNPPEADKPKPGRRRVGMVGPTTMLRVLGSNGVYYRMDGNIAGQYIIGGMNTPAGTVS